VIKEKERLEGEVPALKQTIQKLETENKNLREKNNEQQKELVHSIDLRKDANN